MNRKLPETLEEAHAVILQQWKIIDELIARVQKLEDQLNKKGLKFY